VRTARRFAERRTSAATVLVIVGFALLGGVGAAVLFARSDSQVDKAWTAVLTVGTGWSFIGAGLVAWRRRPDYRTGPWMIVTGFLWLISAVVAGNTAGFFTVGNEVDTLAKAAFVMVLLGYPDGRLRRWPERAVATITWLDVTVVQLAVLMFTPSPRNLIQIGTHPQLAQDLHSAQRWTAFALVAIALALVARRLRTASPPMRRALLPVLASGALVLVLVGASVVANENSWPAAEQLVLAQIAAYGLVPYAFLAGLFRSRLARASVADLVVQLGERVAPGSLCDSIARALGDASLEVAYWLPESASYADASGQPVSLPADGGDRAVTPVERGGVRVAALIHDPGLGEDPELLQAVVAAAGLALENERLQAELRAKLEELRASRSRIVQAGDSERRRLERNLHDGAQQRLLALSFSLGLAESQPPDGSPSAAKLARDAKQEVVQAIEELRELARGIHPTILTDRGLAVALQSVAARSPMPVALSIDPERLPEPIETAAYYVVSEAIANATKHANAKRIDVTIARRDGQVVIEVADDGVGGASARTGSGLRGLVDRVEALDGTLFVTSPAGAGTTIRGRSHARSRRGRLGPAARRPGPHPHRCRI
jgi:signal transduction histidine kinase